jgi:hypothetical protein
MILFKRQKKSSSLRFCQSVKELPCFELFSSRDLTLMISKLSIFDGDPLQDQPEAKAFCIIEGAWESLTVLPIELAFNFGLSADKEAGSGRGFVDRWDGDDPHYRGQFWINDPDRVIFEKFQSAFEHASASGLSYLRLVLRKEKWRDRYKRQRDMGRTEALKADREASEAISALIRDINSGDAELPDIYFNQVLFEDCISLKAPRWSYTEAGDDFSRPIFHNLAVSKRRRRREDEK